MTQHWTDATGKPLAGSGLIMQLSSSLQLMLYQNSLSPDHNTVIGDLTECNFPGYARINLTGSWSLVGLDGSFNVVYNGGAYTWTCTGSSPSNNVYGYALVDGSGQLCMAENNPTGPVTIDTSGLTYTVILKVFVNNNPAP